MGAAEVAEVVAGALLVAIVLWDLFQSVVLPRPAVGRLRVSLNVTRWLWRAWRAAGTRIEAVGRREAALAAFGPASVIIMLGIWAFGVAAGFALLLLGLHDQIRPQPAGFGEALYFSLTAMLTIGFGDLLAVGPAARAVVTIEAGVGLGVVALVISLLFSLFSSFQRREVLVITLDAAAGAPPSGVQILETCAKYRMPEQLVRIFDDWRTWSAEVLESHLAYPVLNYFRSSHDNEAWVNSFGAVMDAASLVVSVLDGGPLGQARLFLKIGEHLVEDVTSYFDFPHDHEVGIEREEFDVACRRLEKAGYLLRPADDAWAGFTALRRTYASPLNRVAHHLALPPAQWIGDRSYLPHGDGARRRLERPAAARR